MKLCLRYIKEYKKNTFTIFMCFSLAIALMAAMLILIHTNHRVASLQNMLIYTPADVRIKNLTSAQIELLRTNKDIKKLSVFEDSVYINVNNNRVYLQRSDNKGMIITSRLEEGNYPQKKNEVVAERWVLLNLGIEPIIGKHIQIVDEESGQKKEAKLTGIMADVLRNKQVGLLTLNGALRDDYNQKYSVYINFTSNENINRQKSKLSEELQINKSKIQTGIGRENMEELVFIDIFVIAIILLICFVIFSGVYRIAILSREDQYGVLRALGIKRQKFVRLILTELAIIYLASIPIGVFVGWLGSFIVIKLSGNEKQLIYLYGERIPFSMLIPYASIAISIIVYGVIVSAVGIRACRKILKKSIIETMFNLDSGIKYKSTAIKIFKNRKHSKAVYTLGWKYLWKDLRTSIYTILTICLGIVLFNGLYYQAVIAKKVHYETKDMCFLNGQYVMSVLNFQVTNSGIRRDDVDKINSIPSISNIETASGLPIRVIENGNIKTNKEYYDEANNKAEEIYGYRNSGFDGKNQVYKSIMYGYNENALSKLQKYVLEGKIDTRNMGDNEIILCVMRKSEYKNNARIGWYKSGDALIDYKVGDEIQLKFQTDFDTNSLDYQCFRDDAEDYSCKKYKVAALVSFPYMFDATYSQYPILITSDRQIEAIAPTSGIQTMYINANNSLSVQEQKKLEIDLIRIGANNHDITTRSLIDERTKTDMIYHKEMVNIYGIAFVFLILAVINMSNNLKYRIQTRKSEICILRAIGMKSNKINQMIIFENSMLGLAAVIIAFGISLIGNKILYMRSDMKAFGYGFEFNIGTYIIIAVIAILICMMQGQKVMRFVSCSHEKA